VRGHACACSRPPGRWPPPQFPSRRRRCRSDITQNPLNNLHKTRDPKQGYIRKYVAYRPLAILQKSPFFFQAGPPRRSAFHSGDGDGESRREDSPPDLRSPFTRRTRLLVFLPPPDPGLSAFRPYVQDRRTGRRQEDSRQASSSPLPSENGELASLRSRCGGGQLLPAPIPQCNASSSLGDGAIAIANRQYRMLPPRSLNVQFRQDPLVIKIAQDPVASKLNNVHPSFLRIKCSNAMSRWQGRSRDSVLVQDLPVHTSKLSTCSVCGFEMTRSQSTLSMQLVTDDELITKLQQKSRVKL
jgi:hypothetical protein